MVERPDTHSVPILRYNKGSLVRGEYPDDIVLCHGNGVFHDDNDDGVKRHHHFDESMDTAPAIDTGHAISSRKGMLGRRQQSAHEGTLR